MRYKLTIAYDGAYFHGFQRQKDLISVQEEIEKAILEVVDTRVGGFDDVIEEVAAHNGFRKGVEWADSHPSRELVEKILNMAYDWDSIEWSGFVDSVKEKLWNETT